MDIYEGKFVNNLPNGKGTFTFSNGDFYQGSFKDGFMHGEGQCTYRNGMLVCISILMRWK